MKKICSLLILGSLALPLTAHAKPLYVVTNGDNDGNGSLRAALDNGYNRILIKKSVSTITLDSTLEYSGSKTLTIIGTGQVIDGSTPESAGDPVLLVSDGANLILSNLEIEGAGGYSIESPGGGKGVFLDIPEDRKGTVRVWLTNVTVRDTGYHGVHISDCQGGDDCGAGAGEGEEPGSPASVFLSMYGVLIDNAGFGRQDGDGVRVDDREGGGIGMVANHSIFQHVGGDGIELDEGGVGSVWTYVRNSLFDNNGAYCFDYDDNGPFDPIATDPTCDDDGDPDVDDAFDIDEAGPGKIANVDLFENFDEGLDFDTQGGPDHDGKSVDLEIVGVLAYGNADEAVKVSEEDEGDVKVKMRYLDIEGDVEVEEEDDGDLKVVLRNSVVGDDLKLAQLGAGEGTLKVRNSTIGDETELDGSIDEI